MTKHSKHVPPFLRYCATSFPTIFNDSMSYYEAICALWKFIETDVVTTINENADETNEYIQLTNQLKEFVETYFDNLDVQEEINNKLDQMAEDGTLAEIIENYLAKKLKVHYVKDSGSCFIIELPNGKNMIYDTGLASAWGSIQPAIDSLGINKFDYAVVSHPHSDHTGNIQNLINNYDFTDCVWYFGMKPDFENHSDEFGEPESWYDDTMAIFTANGITPIIPEDNSVITIDNIYKVSLRFLNTSSEVAENYYGRYAEWKLNEYKAINYNDFSLMVEITYKDSKLLFTGDIERPVEEAYSKELSKVDFITMPHHGSNQDACREFYYTLMPDYALCTIPSSSPLVEDYYKSFYYCVETGATIINNQNSVPVNNMFSFECNGIKTTSNSKGGSLSDNYFNYGGVFTNIRSLVKWTSQDPETITLQEMLKNLPTGYDMTITWRSAYDDVYPQVLEDLKALFPVFEANTKIEIKSRNIFYEVRAYNEKFDFLCEMSSDFAVTKLGGNGELGAFANEEALLTMLAKLPFGHYTSNSYRDTSSSVLAPSLSYLLEINMTNKSSSTGVGFITATCKDLQAHSVTTVATTYYQTNQTPSLFWRRIV